LLYGYAGKILTIDLTRRKITETPLIDELPKRFIGGVGIASKILYDNTPARIDAFDPLNPLIFFTGALTGTPVPSAGRHFIAAKSPLTGYFGDSNAGGFWGAELKYAGYDGVIFSGRSTRPVYVWICDGHAEIYDASGYWNMNAREADKAIRKDLGDMNAKVADIGIAGENLVRVASIMNEEASRAAGRCGMGAIMGFKMLKAVAVRGHNKITIAHPDEVEKKIVELTSMLKNDEGTKYTSKYGTPGVYGLCSALGDAPLRNWSRSGFSAAEEITFGPGGGYQKVAVGRRSCIYCPVGCRRIVQVNEGPYETEPRVEGPEYESLASLGGDCVVGNIEAIAKANELCNLYGLDTISTGSIVAFAMECYENGLITKKDTEGVEVKFGNCDALVILIEKIAKREGLGKILGEGVRRASLNWPGSEYFAIHVKGLEMGMHDPRVYPAMALTYAASPVGADHMEGETTFIEGLFNVPYPLLELEGLQRSSTYRKAEAAFKIQNLWHVFGNCMGYCLIGSATGATAYPLEYNLAFFESVTGRKMSFSEAMKIGERVFNLKKAFNVRHGATRAEDTLPERLLKESHKKGVEPAKLTELLPQYYDLRGWDHVTGKPTRKKLQELGLPEIAEDLWPT
jgi:aldehyde:ferredoxin oxidoreductase